MPHLLIVDAQFYSDIGDELLKGAFIALEQAGATFDHVSVPGVLEIPAAISMAVKSNRNYDGYVALGCVIRGETSHYDIVAIESARAIMNMSVQVPLAIGNGILTVENHEQAWARAKTSDKNKGAGAANAALAMIEVRQKMETL